MVGEWYRQHDGLQERVDELIDDACDRGLFDPDAVRDVRQSHLDRETEEISTIAGITTAECWIQRHLD
jgi:asparagine synthase (glutamine-hydrolysing)